MPNVRSLVRDCALLAFAPGGCASELAWHNNSRASEYEALAHKDGGQTSRYMPFRIQVTFGTSISSLSRLHTSPKSTHPGRKRHGSLSGDTDRNS
jgi:hypothetical protein